MIDIQKQGSQPLFPDTQWSKPVNRKAAKKMLIIGGNERHFQLTQAVYTAAIKAGIGEAKVVLPASLQKAVGNHPDCLYVATTTSGTLAKSAFDEIKVYAEDCDGLLLGPELSANAETISLIEHLLTDLKIDMCLGNEAINLMLFNADAISFALNRLVVAPVKTLVKLAAKYHLPFEVKAEAGILNYAHLLDGLGNFVPANYALTALDLMIWSNHQVSHTKLKTWTEPTLLAYLFTYYLQQPDKFKGLTTAAYELSRL